MIVMVEFEVCLFSLYGFFCITYEFLFIFVDKNID